MTFRIPMFLAATLLVASHAAYASPSPTNTDEVRALAEARTPPSAPRLTRSLDITSTNTDEIRALVASAEPASPVRLSGSANVISTNTDEVRALAGRMVP